MSTLTFDNPDIPYPPQSINTSLERLHFPCEPQTMSTDSSPAPSVYESASGEIAHVPFDDTEDDMSSVVLSYDCISEAMERCSDTILPVMLDSKRIINHLGNKGLTKFQKIVRLLHEAFDLSSCTAIESSAILRRIGTYMETTELTHEDIKVFGTLLEDVWSDSNDASDRFQRLHGRLFKLFSSSESFHPPEPSIVPVAKIEEDQYMHIVACVRNHVAFKRGEKGINQFSTLEDILLQAEPFIQDVLEIYRWWQESIDCVSDLRTKIQFDDIQSDPISFKNGVWILIRHLQPWVSKTHIMIPLQPHTKAWKATTKILIEMRRNNALPLAERTISLPPKDWVYKEVPKLSFAIIAQELDLAMGRQGDRHVSVDARVTACQYFPTAGTYGIRIKIQHREQVGLENRRRLCRCAMMDISVSISSQDSNNKKRAAITTIAPERNTYNKSDVKFLVKGSAKLAPSAASIKVGEVGVEVGREVTRSENGKLMGHQTMKGDATWVLVENKSSKSGVVDCELGIMFAPPSDQIIIKLDIKATYVVDMIFRIIPWTVRRPADLTGTLPIDLTEADQQIPTLGTDQQEFLAPCSALAPKEV